MKSAASMLLVGLLLFLSPALALEGPAVLVEEEPTVQVQKRLTALVEEESGAPTLKAPTILVQEEPPAQPQEEPEAEEPEQPEAAPQEPQAAPPDEPEEPAQPEPAAPAEQAPDPPVPQAPEPPSQQEPDSGARRAPEGPVQLAAAAPIQEAFAAPDEQTPAAPTENYQHNDPTYLSEIASDFRYTVNNAEADVEDLVTAPLHLGEAGSLFVQPAFYYTVLGAGAALGGAFALDQTIRAHVRHMGHGTADGFETGGNAFMWGNSALVYLWGLQSADSNLRESEITGFEAAGISSLITMGFKDAFSRLRPRQGHGHFAFFDQGGSFVSGAATPVFALAAATSEAYDNAWYAAIPAYLGATAVGVGRMGKDAHWVSDIVGSALVGIGTTELMLYMHRWHAENPSRFRIFPVSAPGASVVSRQTTLQGLAPQGLGIAYEW